MAFRDEFSAQLTRYGERHRVAAFKVLCGHLVELLRDDGLCARFEECWRGREFHEPAHRPLLVLDALRYDALLTGQDHPLFGALSSPPHADRATRAALAAALDPARRLLWRTLKTHSIQTNETSRALAWLWPAKLAGCDHGARALALLDIGASAGLNLVADALPSVWTSGGARLPIVEKPRVLARLGIDQNPLDALQREHARWLEACIWPSDEARLTRLHAAIAAWKDAQTGDNPPRVQRADLLDAPEMLAIMSRELPGDALLLAYHTIAREYLDPASRTKFDEAMTDCVKALPPGRALWIEMENADAPMPPYYVAVTAHFRRGDGVQALELGRCEFHPTDVMANAGAVRELREAFRA